MPSIMKTTMALALALSVFLGILALSGCGETNSHSSYDPDLGKHPAGWLPFGHAGPALANLQDCRSCHGQDFNGGISKVSCHQCHQFFPFPGEFPPVAAGAPHPAEWDIHGPLGYALHATYVRQHGASGCATIYCHGENLQGGMSGPSCSSCHLGGPFRVHPPDWENQITIHGGYVRRFGTASCRNAVCHGTALQGVFLSGHACNDCHQFVTPIADQPVNATPP